MRVRRTGSGLGTALQETAPRLLGSAQGPVLGCICFDTPAALVLREQELQLASRVWGVVFQQTRDFIHSFIHMSLRMLLASCLQGGGSVFALTVL